MVIVTEVSTKVHVCSCLIKSMCERNNRSCRARRVSGCVFALRFILPAVRMGVDVVCHISRPDRSREEKKTSGDQIKDERGGGSVKVETQKGGEENHGGSD